MWLVIRRGLSGFETVALFIIGLDGGGRCIAFRKSTELRTELEQEQIVMQENLEDRIVAGSDHVGLQDCTGDRSANSDDCLQTWQAPMRNVKSGVTEQRKLWTSMQDSPQPRILAPNLDSVRLIS